MVAAFAAFFLAFVGYAAATTQLPLCATIKGFAGEINEEFDVIPPVAPRSGEALILVLRPVPYLASMNFIAAEMNVSYKILGVDTFAMSDRYGIVQIADQIEPDTPLHVRVKNLRTDGSTPFLFYSYHAGYRSCSLEISPRASFTGPMPTKIFNSNSQGVLYLKSVPPPGATAFQLVLMGDVTAWYSRQTGEDGAAIGRDALTPLESSTSVIYFTLRPSSTMAATQMVHAAIAWTTQGVPASQQPQQPVVTMSPEDSVAATAAPGGVRGAAQRVATEASSSMLPAIFVIVLVYFTSRTVYNYRVQGITTFPEYVPHHEFFSGCSAFCSAFAAQVKHGRPSVFNRHGYHDVNRAEMYPSES